MKQFKIGQQVKHRMIHDNRDRYEVGIGKQTAKVKFQRGQNSLIKTCLLTSLSVVSNED